MLRFALVFLDLFLRFVLCLLIELLMVTFLSYRECPVELKEAISSMIYASSRCGEFPELLEIRNVLTSRFGKEFAARAIELRNDCGVNPKVYISIWNIARFEGKNLYLANMVKICFCFEMGIILKDP